MEDIKVNKEDIKEENKGLSKEEILADLSKKTGIPSWKIDQVIKEHTTKDGQVIMTKKIREILGIKGTTYVRDYVKRDENGHWIKNQVKRYSNK